MAIVIDFEDGQSLPLARCSCGRYFVGVRTLNLKCAQFFLATLSLFLCSNSSFAAKEAREKVEFYEDYEEGLAVAKKDKRDVLLFFFGSDWCEKCERLDEFLISKPGFKNWVKENYVFVKLDFPLEKPEVTKGNEPTRSRLKARDFPIFFALDSKGFPYAQLPYRVEWDEETYLGSLKALPEQKKARDKARKAWKDAATDEERVKALEAFFKVVPSASAEAIYSEEFTALREASDDKSDFVAITARNERYKAFEQKLYEVMVQKNYEGAVTCCDDYILAGQTAVEEQVGWCFKYQIYTVTEDWEEAAKAAEKINQLDPTTAVGRQSLKWQSEAKKRASMPPQPKPTGTEREISGDFRDLNPTTDTVGEGRAVTEAVQATPYVPDEEEKPVVNDVVDVSAAEKRVSDLQKRAEKLLDEARQSLND